MPQNAGPTWNNFAAMYNFGQYPAAANATFRQVYSGTNISFDFIAIKVAVAQALETAIPTTNTDDLVNISLETWPDK